jgi:hypothetical protein
MKAVAAIERAREVLVLYEDGKSRQYAVIETNMHELGRLDERLGADDVD